MADYKFDGRTLRDRRGVKVGTLDGAHVRDARGTAVGKIDGLGGASLVAMWLFFVR